MKIALAKANAFQIDPAKKYFILLTSAEGWKTADIGSANKEIRKTFPNLRIRADRCKNCGKKLPYDRSGPVRLFCSHKCCTTWYQGERHYEWAGSTASYVAIHLWISKIAGRPSLCEHCGTTTAKKFEWANISGQYKRERSDWVRLCTRCHHA